MYDNFTPNDGQVSSSRGNLVPVTNSNPCPHCGQPDWCYSIGELTACKRPQYPPAAGWEVTSKTDKDGTPFYAPIREKKAIRPRQTRYWEYPARDGSPLSALYGSMMAKVARAVKVMLTGIKNIGVNANQLDKLAG